MKILNVLIENHKSIKDSGEINLHNKINTFAGKNNTGKSAFIEAIYKVTHGELTESLNRDPDTVTIVMDINLSDEELSLLYEEVDEPYKLINSNLLQLTYIYDINQNRSFLETIERFADGTYTQFYFASTEAPNMNYFVINKFDKKIRFSGIPVFLTNIHKLCKDKIIYVNGSRYVQSKERIHLQNSLQIEGTNLNTLLYTLNNNDPRIFNKINQTFRQIFNDVLYISTPVNENDQTHISIYFEGINIPIPLSECGSGYTHVLLLLSVLYTKENSIVLFDEPQVFLHPSAEKAIYDLVSENSEHQYIFTTHSPILINYPMEKHLVHVSKSNGVSTFTQLEKIQELLSDIGISNSNYALSDKVIFVEGETEECMFPIILSHFGLKQIGYNYRILNMKGTGNYFSKNSAMREYKNKLDLVLSGISESPIPYKIIIDADNKTKEKLLTLKESYGDNIIILERREYENYFLDCYQEISEIINQNLSIAETNPDRIKSEIDHLLLATHDTKLFPKKDSRNALKDVVGSEVLERLFEIHSLHYNKIVHGMELTTLVLKNNPEKLEFFKNELQDFIKG
ncbi:AAA family ATPase [Paenibacillus sp. FSL F4-0087]|uniref:ATP-dependent nuclease n=1 Tax=Paenibacillus sp. FSL F4-0087 TaxID=2921368 RepID=UPI0030F9E161